MNRFNSVGRRAFTFVELLVCLILVCLTAGWLFAQDGPVAKTRETAHRAKCADNLRQIGRALLIYGNANKGKYPRVVLAPNQPPTQYTGVDCKDPFGKVGVP